MKGGRVASARTGRAMLPPIHQRILLNITIGVNQGNEKTGRRSVMRHFLLRTCKISAPLPCKKKVCRDSFFLKDICSYGISTPTRSEDMRDGESGGMHLHHIHEQSFC